MLYPSLNNVSSNTLPKTIQHMIEDESFDDYGPNSGQRFIVQDSDIITFSLKETPPSSTVIEVNGALAGGLVEGPSGASTSSGGNGIAAASAVDYDMWRLYGFRSGQGAMQVPYLSDSEAQCAPYAVFMLNKARKDVFSASATLRGNGIMQAGEVYYIDDYGLLFYAEDVSS